LALATIAPTPRPSRAWELAGVYAFAAGLDEAAGGYARDRIGAPLREVAGIRDFNGRLGLKLTLAPVYVWSANRMLRSSSKRWRVAGRVMEVALPAVYVYGAVVNIQRARGGQ